MTVTLIGAGCGTQTLTREAVDALQKAGLVLGARRLLDIAPTWAEKREAVYTRDILAAIRASEFDRICVLFSGDSGFYSGARLLLPELQNCETRLLPGLSSVQLFAARLQRPWQDWLLASAHGTDCDLPALLRQGRPVFLLTGGKNSVNTLLENLVALSLGNLTVSVGENLGLEAEHVHTGTASDFLNKSFAPLSVLLLEAVPSQARRSPGLPDSAFERAEGIPMSKQAVRALVLAKLGVQPGDVCWDIGSGTGSVSVELALQSKEVWAVERDAAAFALSQRNRERFHAWNLRLVQGEAPEALAAFPAPDAVFVGGSGGALEAIIRAVYEKNPRARVCVAAIAIETAEAALRTLEALGYDTELTQLAVSSSRRAGQLHLLLAQNPVCLITGTRS